MNCFPCFQNKGDDDEEETGDIPIAQPKNFTPPTSPPVNNSFRDPLADRRNDEEEEDTTVKSFTFREIATATKNFRQECLLGEGGFGKVFRGTLQGSGQVVAVRQLERNTGGKDFVFEISNLSLLRHPNLVKMVGYCGEGEQRHLVYEYMPSGSLKSYLFDLEDGQKPLDWSQRMKIAYGIASGLEYLHEKADPVVIYRDLRSSNVLLTETKNPKLSDYGLAKIVQGGNKMHMSVMTGFNGYCAPEFEKNGELTVKSDVYSFGVVMLELITGRRALDTSLPADEQSLVSWAQPKFKDPSKFSDMADPRLRKGFPVTGLNQAVGIAAMCLQEEPIARPLISDISAAISFLAMAPPQAPLPEPELAPEVSRVPTSRQDGADNDEAQKYDDSSSESEEEYEHREEEQREGDHNRQKQYDHSSEEYDDSSDDSEPETSKNIEKAPANVKKPSMKIQSRSDSRRNNTNSMKTQSRSDSRRNSKKSMKVQSSSNNKKPMKIETPSDSRSNRSSCSSSDGNPPPVQQVHDQDHYEYSSSSDDENWDGRDGDRCPSRSSSVSSDDDRH